MVASAALIVSGYWTKAQLLADPPSEGAFQALTPGKRLATEVR